MSLLPSQSQVNGSLPLYVPNQGISALNTSATTGAINNGSFSTIQFKSTIANVPGTYYLANVCGAITLSNIGGAGSNMSYYLQAVDGAYNVTTPVATVTGSNTSGFNLVLPFEAQSPNTQLKFVVNNIGSANTANATVALYTNSIVAPIGTSIPNVNYFQ